MATLPQLDTGGVDITNTIAKIAAMKHMALQNENLQSEIANREATAPSLIAERESQNALRTIQTKSAQQKNVADKIQDAVKATAWVKDHPDPEKAYATVQAQYTKEGIEMPTADAFYSTDKEGNSKFDVDKFSTFADGGIRAMNLALKPEEGKHSQHQIINPAFDKDQPVSADNPKLIEKTFVVRNGKLVPDDTVPPKPIVDPIQKEADIEADKAATRKETKRHNLSREGIEGARLNLAKKQAERENSEYIGTTDDKKSIITRDKKTNELKIVPIPEDKKIEGKPTDKKKGGAFSDYIKSQQTENAPSGPSAVTPSPTKKLADKAALRAQAKAAIDSGQSKLTPDQIKAKYEKLTGEKY
jgi:hypothetical protein